MNGKKKALLPRTPFMSQGRHLSFDFLMVVLSLIVCRAQQTECMNAKKQVTLGKFVK